jgi:hypothetical protein
MKMNFDVKNGMLFSGLAACLRMFNEKEKEMMAGAPGNPFWRCMAELEFAVSSHAHRNFGGNV